MGGSGLRVRVGDTVVVISGQDKGRVGKIVRVDIERRRVAVEGVAVVKRHIPQSSGQQGSVVYRERMIDVSNISFWNEAERRKVKVAYGFREDGRKIRIDKVSGAAID